MKFNDFISRFPNVKKSAKGFMVKCPCHDDGSASLSVGEGDNGWILLKCFAGCDTKSVVGSMGLSMKDLFGDEPAPEKWKSWTPPISQKVEKADPKVKPEIEKIYSYQDALGREVYQAIRLKPKSFRQRHQKNGEWIWTMDGVERVLYRLPEIIKNNQIWIVEGEKDADNLAALGFCSTCNVGGAGKWLDAYTESLAGKDVILCGDNDEPGKKHVELVFESIAPKAKSVRIVKLPSNVKDASDLIATFKEPSMATAEFNDLMQSATPHIGGISMPIYSMADLEAGYKKSVEQSAKTSLDLSCWLPAFKYKLRPLVAGELALIIGDTGTGKTGILQNIAMATKLKTLMFEMELPADLLFERFFAIRANMTCAEIEKEYRNNPITGEKSMVKEFPNIFICPESRMSLEKLEALILRSELKIGEKPALVLIDYVQLLQGEGSRYEKTSNVAEGLKVLAKSTKTIIIVASQVGRNTKDDGMTLHSAKDSGSLENSAGLVIGAVKDGEDKMLLKILKSTKGGAGAEIVCNFDGAKMKITQHSGIDKQDMP